MFCQRCDRPLKDDEAEVFDNPGTSGAGSTIVVCKEWCTPSPHQTSPVPGR
ncbi:hypothetical protein ACPCUF_23620 [Streptomyces griseoincarnatus]